VSAVVNTWTLAPGQPRYPACLEELRPGERPHLHGSGDLELVAGLERHERVTIVGSRNASGYGVRVAQRLARDLAVAGIAVVSGMARGIDSAAHKGALEGGGGTLAVLAGGPDFVYPRRNAGLYERILDSGAIVAERPPGTKPRPHDFAERNRIMAALSGVTVIVEAALPSGSLITADRALDLGRTVCAVPGQLGVRVAEGPNALIRDGATLVRDARDILDLLYGVGIGPEPAPDRERPVLTEIPKPRPGPPLDGRLARVRELVAAGCATVDRIANEGGIASRDAAVALARLELLGYVAADALGGWSVTDQRAPE
jgi:DNA processing protein